MPFGQVSRLNVHGDVRVLLGVPRPENFAIWSRVYEEELAAENAVSALEQVVRGFWALGQLSEGNVFRFKRSEQWCQMWVLLLRSSLLYHSETIASSV